VIAKTAAALCVAARWSAAASLVLTAVAFNRLPGDGAALRMLLAAIVAAGAVQAYLAFRIELDRVIFEAAANETAVFERFDAALAAIGLARRAGGRLPEERAAGLWRLVKSGAIVLALQFALAVAAAFLAGCSAPGGASP
jgi:hypothetical protein